MYAYPNRFPWDLTRLLRDHPRVIPYLDIPVQHISTPVLRAMRRAGSGDQVRAILDRLLEEVPGITLRTTLLVGFPGERAEDAEQLREFVRRYRLSRVGTFRYSPEQDTPGFDLAHDVSAQEASRREDAVLAVRDEILERTQNEWVGRETSVLVDESHPDGNGREAGQSGPRGSLAPLAPLAIGRTDMDAPEVDLVTIVPDCEAAVGERVQVRIEGLDEHFNLIARPLAVGSEAGA
jgi:ribosomal protein S12 methylthiotransferase